MLFPEERALLLMPSVPLEMAPEIKASDGDRVTATSLVEFQRSRWTWQRASNGMEYLLLEDTEWTQKAIRVDDLVRNSK